QRMAGTAMGLTQAQSYRYVILPQSLRIILPPLTSEFMNVIKNSSVARTIGLLELTGRARAMQEFSFRVFEAFRAAYYCEIMRAGIQSIARGQVWSGYALGLNYWQTMGQVVLPQAFRNMTPVLLTQTIILFQDTSLVYVISATDFLGAASKVANRDYRLVEMYTFAAAVYFLMSYSLSLLVRRLQDRIAVIR
ncbi:MAG TPA: ABC transporter permease subunit, partial [Burkholderiales bacterium]|nr:ABC transporter permease subunit [Burkholderiales bacterium]